jgi:hypothetical protein
MVALTDNIELRESITDRFNRYSRLANEMIYWCVDRKGEVKIDHSRRNFGKLEEHSRMKRSTIFANYLGAVQLLEGNEPLIEEAFRLANSASRHINSEKPELIGYFAQEILDRKTDYFSDGAGI